MTQKRLFVSFDFENDRTAREFVIGQSRLPDSPFEVIDHSLKEAQPERDWEQKARAAIARSDVVMVVLGPHTRTAPGVLKEIQLTRELGKPIFQMIGYRDGSEEWAVPGAGRTYRWNWSNLKTLLS